MSLVPLADKGNISFLSLAVRWLVFFNDNCSSNMFVKPRLNASFYSRNYVFFSFLAISSSIFMVLWTFGERFLKLIVNNNFNNNFHIVFNNVFDLETVHSQDKVQLSFKKMLINLILQIKKGYKFWILLYSSNYRLQIQF